MRIPAFAAALAALTLIAACQNGEADVGAPDPAADTPVISLYASDHGLRLPVVNDPFFGYMESQANVRLDVTYLAHSQYNDQLRLKFAGGYMPDVYQSWSAPEPALVEDGKILVLNELIERYGPNLKRNIPQATWDAVTVNGQILAIPQPTGSQQGQVIYVRQDWLDKLNLDVPKTSDDLLQVMRAFKTRDPNGNGIADEIPFTMRQNFNWGENLFGMWGIYSLYSETAYNGEIILGNVHPNMVPALDYMKTMYAEGLLDPDFMTNSKSTWEQKIKAGLVGIWCHAPGLAWQWQRDLEASIGDQHPDVVAIETPQGAGYDGPVGVRWSPLDKTFILFKNARHPEAIIRWLDWLVSAEGQVFTDLGLEGVTYEKQDGSYVYDAEAAGKAGIDWLRTIYKLHGLNETTEAAWVANKTAYEKLKRAYAIADSQGFVSETIGMPNIENDYHIHSLFPQEAAEIIIGNKEPASYLDFIAEWKASGGQRLIDERTRWVKENRRENI